MLILFHRIEKRFPESTRMVYATVYDCAVFGVGSVATEVSARCDATWSTGGSGGRGFVQGRGCLYQALARKDLVVEGMYICLVDFSSCTPFRTLIYRTETFYQHCQDKVFNLYRTYIPHFLQYPQQSKQPHKRYLLDIASCNSYQNIY